MTHISILHTLSVLRTLSGGGVKSLDANIFSEKYRFCKKHKIASFFKIRTTRQKLSTTFLFATIHNFRILNYGRKMFKTQQNLVNIFSSSGFFSKIDCRCTIVHGGRSDGLPAVLLCCWCRSRKLKYRTCFI